MDLVYVYEEDEISQSWFTSQIMSWCHYFYPAHLNPQDLLAPGPGPISITVLTTSLSPLTTYKVYQTPLLFID